MKDLVGLDPKFEEEMRSWPLGPGPDLARPGLMHFLLNIQAQAHPNPSILSLPAPRGRASGRLSAKKRKIVFLGSNTEEERRSWPMGLGPCISFLIFVPKSIQILQFPASQPPEAAVAAD